jgi:peptidoglycan/LPS O-acetylase OafA/YrhL
LLQSWDGHFRNINASSWLLSAEGFFYFIFPFVSFLDMAPQGGKAFGLFVLFGACSLLTPVLVTLRYPTVVR